MNIQPIKSALTDIVLLARDYRGKITPKEEEAVHELMAKRRNGIGLSPYEARFLQTIYDIKTEFLQQVRFHARKLFFLFAKNGSQAPSNDFDVNEKKAIAARHLLTSAEKILFESLLDFSLLERRLENNNTHEVEVEEVENDLEELVTEGLRIGS